MRLDTHEKIKRLVIYFFYDADGIVDRYVPYLLKDMRKNCTELFVVCNGKLTPEGRKSLEDCNVKLMVRENKGFDVWAYKTAMEHYGWDEIVKFDEVVLMNFTFYGPLYPFSEMFKEMDRKDLDFWGLTKHYKIPFDPYGTTGLNYIPEHIQSSFICIRKPMLKSLEFQKYWDDMGPINDYKDAVGKHEAIFTKKFIDCGFKCDTYVKTDDLEEYTRYPLMFEAKEMIQHRQCPIFKKKMFTNEYYEYLDASAGEAALETYEYIQANFDYDMDMFWENVLRTSNMADIKDRMHLNFVLNKNVCAVEKPSERVALIMHLYFEDLIPDSMRYASSMPENADIYFTVCKESMYQAVEKAAKILMPRKVKVIQIENRGRDVSSLLVGGAPYVDRYDLICFAHDKKTSQNKPYTVGQSFAYKCLENVLASKPYVQNIIQKFHDEPRLGMLMPPTPNHSVFYDGVGGEWTINYDNVKELAEELKLKVNIDVNKEPISPLGTMFWFRPKALKPLFDKKWKFKDFPEEPNKVDGTILHAVERVYGFVVQSQGFYCAWAMNDSFARIELTNLHFMVRETAKALHCTRGYYCGFLGMIQNIYNFPNPAIQAQSYLSPTNVPLRIQIKRRIKKSVPKPIWNLARKIYHAFGGRKWVG